MVINLKVEELVITMRRAELSLIAQTEGTAESEAGDAAAYGNRKKGVINKMNPFYLISLVTLTFLTAETAATFLHYDHLRLLGLLDDHRRLLIIGSNKSRLTVGGRWWALDVLRLAIGGRLLRVVGV